MATTKAPQTQVMKLTFQSRYNLTPDEAELYELTFLAGIVMDPQVFKIILDLLKMNVAPTAIMQMLKSLRNRRKKGPSSILSTSSNDSSGSKPHSTRSDPTSTRDPAGRDPGTRDPAGTRTQESSGLLSVRPRERPSSARPDRPPSRSKPTKDSS